MRHQPAHGASCQPMTSCACDSSHNTAPPSLVQAWRYMDNEKAAADSASLHYLQENGQWDTVGIVRTVDKEVELTQEQFLQHWLYVNEYMAMQLHQLTLEHGTLAMMHREPQMYRMLCHAPSLRPCFSHHRPCFSHHRPCFSHHRPCFSHHWPCFSHHRCVLCACRGL